MYSRYNFSPSIASAIATTMSVVIVMSFFFWKQPVNSLEISICEILKLDKFLNKLGPA